MKRLDPDVAALIGMKASSELAEAEAAPEVADQPISYLNQDISEIRRAIEDWHQVLQSQLVPAQSNILDGYRFKTNTSRSPYSWGVHADLQCQREGWPILLCDEALIPNTRDSAPDLIAVFQSPDAQGDIRRSIVDLVIAARKHPAHRLASSVGNGSINSFMFDSRWREMPNADWIMHSHGLSWAEANGLAIPAFMTSVALKKIRYEDTGIEGLPDITADNHRLYEEAAAEVDGEGHRRFYPFSIEQFAGLVFRAVNENEASEDDDLPTLN